MDYNRGGLLHYSRLGKYLQYQLVKEKKKKEASFHLISLGKKDMLTVIFICYVYLQVTRKKIECVPFFASL